MSVLDKLRLDGKVALMTGAGRGLGCVMAVALAEAGADSEKKWFLTPFIPRGGAARTRVAYLGRTEGALQLREIAGTLALDIARVSRLAQDTVFRAHALRAVKMLTEKSKH